MTQTTDEDGVWEIDPKNPNARWLIKPSKAWLQKLPKPIQPPKPRTVQEIQSALEKGEHVTHEELERLVLSQLK